MPMHGLPSVKKALRKTKADANIKLYGIYFTGLSFIIRRTPTDKGRARNNWFMTSGTPFSLSGRKADSSGSGSSTSLMTMEKNVLNKKIYFSNNLPYIGMLEYGGYSKRSTTGKTINGFSRQVAPDGWVRDQLKIMANEVRKL